MEGNTFPGRPSPHTQDDLRDQTPNPGVTTALRYSSSIQSWAKSLERASGCQLGLRPASILSVSRGGAQRQVGKSILRFDGPHRPHRIEFPVCSPTAKVATQGPRKSDMGVDVVTQTTYEMKYSSDRRHKTAIAIWRAQLPEELLPGREARCFRRTALAGRGGTSEPVPAIRTREGVWV